MKKKPSELFEGPNSSLRKTFDDAVKDTKSEDSMPQGSEEILGVIDTPYTEWEGLKVLAEEIGAFSYSAGFNSGKGLSATRERVVLDNLKEQFNLKLSAVISSRDTYWKERVEGAYEAGRTYESKECRGSVADNHPNAPCDLPEYFPWKEKFEAITNQDNLK